MNTAAKEKFDADISRINIVAEISPNTVNIAKGETVSVIYVLQVILKHKEFEDKTISQISKLIDQNMVLVLDCDGERKLAIHHTKLLQTEWAAPDECSLNLIGLNLDKVWENLITQVGGIDAGLTNGYRIINNCGEDGCQTVKHIHFHVLGGKKLPENMG